MKSEADIKAAIKANADAVGFLIGQVHTSNDFISTDKARDLARLLPSSIEPIIVTHLKSSCGILQLVKETKITTIQLHGSPDAKTIKELRENKLKLIYSAHIHNGKLSADLKDIYPLVDMILLDSCDLTLGKVGGTGQTHDWNVSAKIVNESPIPVILAGGLNPENVAQAIQTVKSFGVDVNSGVKNTSGFRSPERCLAFVTNAKTTT